MERRRAAEWFRAELNRVLNHLMFLGSYPLELGAITPIFYAFRERELILDLFEEFCGASVPPEAVRTSSSVPSSAAVAAAGDALL